MTCGSCSRPATVKLSSGLWRCQTCYEGFFHSCKWPRDPYEFVKPDPVDTDKPWRKWLPDPEQEDQGWYR